MDNWTSPEFSISVYHCLLYVMSNAFFSCPSGVKFLETGPVSCHPRSDTSGAATWSPGGRPRKPRSVSGVLYQRYTQRVRSPSKKPCKKSDTGGGDVGGKEKKKD